MRRRVEGAGSIGGEIVQVANSAEGSDARSVMLMPRCYLEGGLTLCEMGWKNRLNTRQGNRKMEAMGVRRQCGDKHRFREDSMCAMSKKCVGQTVEFPSTRWSSAPAHSDARAETKKVAQWSEQSGRMATTCVLTMIQVLTSSSPPLTVISR